MQVLCLPTELRTIILITRVGLEDSVLYIHTRCTALSGVQDINQISTAYKQTVQSPSITRKACFSFVLENRVPARYLQLQRSLPLSKVRLECGYPPYLLLYMY